MKIQNISPFKYKYSFNTQKTASKPFNSTNQFDSFTFTGTKVSYDEIRPVKIQAYKTQIEATELQGKSNAVVREAYEQLAIAKDEYIKALNIIKIFNQDPQRQTRKLKNGNELRFKTEYKNDVCHLEAREVSQDGETIRSFSAVNSIPSNLMTYGDSENYYTFTGTKVTIMQGMNVQSSMSGGAKAVYNYNLGRLTSASIDLQALDDPQSVSQSYFYDSNGELIIYANNCETSGSSIKCDERYVFDNNGKLLTYFDEFCTDSQSGTLSFNEGLHFDSGR
ncbi:hypothetical protein IJX73_03310, partial [bacterium]|nr:hypothetical protein [bacterium]